MTSSFLNVEVNGTRRALLTGGWNDIALNDSAIFEPDTWHWNFLSPDPLPYPIRASVPIERNRTPFLLGGLLCSTNGERCNQTDKGWDHSNNTWRFFDSPHNITVFKANRLLTVKWIRNEAFFKASLFSQLWLATSKSIKIRVQKNLSLLTNILPVKQEYVGSLAASKKTSL